MSVRRNVFCVLLVGSAALLLLYNYGVIVSTIYNINYSGTAASGNVIDGDARSSDILSRQFHWIGVAIGWNSDDDRAANAVATNSSSSSRRRSENPQRTSAASLPSLEELVRTMTINTTDSYPCPAGMKPFPDFPPPPPPTRTSSNSSSSFLSANAKKKIPMIVHVTAKSRCMTPKLYKHVKQWRLDGHGLYFHDDDAVARLMNIAFRDIGGTGLVPNLERVYSCASNGATMADLWRYVVMWYYGGIYTDMDNSPVGFNASTIHSDDDAFFVVEKLGVMSQFFFASVPGHPLWLHTLNSGIELLHATKSVMYNLAPYTTGPRAVKVGFIRFQNVSGIRTNGYMQPDNVNPYSGGKFTYPAAAVTIAANGTIPFTEGDINSMQDRRNYTVTVVGNKTKAKEFIDRGGIKNWHRSMNMTHHKNQRFIPNKKLTLSCEGHIRRQEERIKREDDRTMKRNNHTSGTTITTITTTRYERANYVYSNVFQCFVDGNHLPPGGMANESSWNASEVCVRRKE